MWYVIVDVKIDLISPEANGTTEWQASKFYPDLSKPSVNEYDKNPLRAAALVAIKVLEARV